jgi:hypothetical protein
VGLDLDSDGEGASAVRSAEVPILLTAGLCKRLGRATLQAWGGAGLSIASVTTEVAGVERTDSAVTSFVAGGADAVAHLGWAAVLVGLGAEASGERWGLGGRAGIGFSF